MSVDAKLECPELVGGDAGGDGLEGVKSCSMMKSEKTAQSSGSQYEMCMDEKWSRVWR